MAIGLCHDHTLSSVIYLLVTAVFVRALYEWITNLPGDNYEGLPSVARCWVYVKHGSLFDINQYNIRVREMKQVVETL